MQKKYNKLRWIGTICGILGASLVASNMFFSKYGFIFFLMNSTIWLWIAWKDNDKALVTLNIFFTFINLFGIYRWLIIPFFNID